MERFAEEKEMQQEYRQQLFAGPDTAPPPNVLHVPQGVAAALVGDSSPDPALDLSHELRTSLAVVTLVSGNLDRLYERLDDSQRRKMIQDIRKHTHRLNDVIGDLLTWSDECGPHSA